MSVRERQRNNQLFWLAALALAAVAAIPAATALAGVNRLCEWGDSSCTHTDQRCSWSKAAYPSETSRWGARQTCACNCTSDNGHTNSEAWVTGDIMASRLSQLVQSRRTDDNGSAYVSGWVRGAARCQVRATGYKYWNIGGWYGDDYNHIAHCRTGEDVLYGMCQARSECYWHDVPTTPGNMPPEA